jgi:hypothetical protein
MDKLEHTDTTSRSLIDDEIDNLPEHYRATFSAHFLMLLATLRLHGFKIAHADEAKEDISDMNDLWVEIGHPSVWFCSSRSADLTRELRNLKRDTPEYIACSNQAIRANLAEQSRMLALLDEFYSLHTPVSFYSKLIVENIDDLAEGYLKPQGAGIWIVQDDKIQDQWHEEFRVEMLAFTKFLAEKL